MAADAAPVIAAIGLGANLGDARQTLVEAGAAIRALPRCDGFATSPLYRSAPVDAGGPDFYNAVVRLTTTLPARRLLEALQAIERTHGRERPFRNAPRTLDLDLLLYGDQRIDDPDLTVPHPRLHLRAFVLRPLADLDPELVVPGHGRVVDLLTSVADQRIERVADTLRR